MNYIQSYKKINEFANKIAEENDLSPEILASYFLQTIQADEAIRHYYGAHTKKIVLPALSKIFYKISEKSKKDPYVSRDFSCWTVPDLSYNGNRIMQFKIPGLDEVSEFAVCFDANYSRLYVYYIWPSFEFKEEHLEETNFLSVLSNISSYKIQNYSDEYLADQFLIKRPSEKWLLRNNYICYGCSTINYEDYSCGYVSFEELKYLLHFYNVLFPLVADIILGSKNYIKKLKDLP